MKITKQQIKTKNSTNRSICLRHQVSNIARQSSKKENHANIKILAEEWESGNINPGAKLAGYIGQLCNASFSKRHNDPSFYLICMLQREAASKISRVSGLA